MPWKKIIRRCGHEEKAFISGPVRDHAWREAREAEKLCYACWHAQKLVERDGANSEAAAEAAEAGWPPLQGTEKQAGWAESLRKEAVTKMERDLDYVKEQAKRIPQLLPVVATARKKLAAVLREEGSARYWIDTRDEPLAGIYAETQAALDVINAHLKEG